MKNANITVVSVSDVDGNNAPMAGANGSLGRLALETQLQAVSGTVDYILDIINPLTGNISNNQGTKEKGETVTSVLLNWSWSKAILSQSLNNGIGSLLPAVVSYLHTSTFTTDRTYTITGSTISQSANASTSVVFRQKRWWGTDPTVTPVDATIFALANNEFSSSRNKSFVINGGGQYIYYAYPSTFGAATFTVNGLLNTAWTLFVISHTNASGFTENYNVYRTNTIQNGSGISIVVS
jgi:hypothetical protein